METDSDFDRLKPGATHDDIMTALVRGAAKTAEWRKTIDRRVHAQEKTTAEILTELRANTAETVRAREAVEAVRDGLTTLRVVKKVIVWAGAIAAAGSAIWLLAQQLVTGKTP